jgi:very-short-patch-repair endonuclease
MMASTKAPFSKGGGGEAAGGLAPFPKGGGGEAAGGLPHNKSLKERSRNLRKNATKQENRLWYDFLRTQVPRWTRQRVIGNYIVDFYCHKRKLVVELDGGQHYQEKNMEYDNRRTLYLNSLGIEVMRFTNSDVDNNFDGVCAALAAALANTETPGGFAATPFGKGG